MGALHDEVVGMFQEEFLPGLLYQARALAKSLCAPWPEHFLPRQDLLLLGARGPSEVILDVVLPRGMLSTGSGERCHLLGLEDCLGTGAGGAAGAGCSFTGEAICDRENG